MRSWAADDWQVGVADQPERELAAYASTDGHLTLIGLDTNPRGLNGPSGTVSAYSIGGMAPNTELTLALWNELGGGERSIAPTVRTDAVGVVRFECRCTRRSR